TVSTNERLGPDGRVLGLSTQTQVWAPADDGWRVIELATEGPDVALSQVLALGDGVEVLAPEELRAALAETGRRIAARNAPAVGGGDRGRGRHPSEGGDRSEGGIGAKVT
ncbi:WYL domain-containing protein, partial [Frankia sp. AiPs1]|uniref:WYL domain-containing protein n=1 Tax=Frankia sp. AiPs1 TaxID=573493 RepID=UPI00204370FB